jgi:hypothetical protein
MLHHRSSILGGPRIKDREEPLFHGPNCSMSVVDKGYAGTEEECCIYVVGIGQRQDKIAESLGFL